MSATQQAQEQELDLTYSDNPREVSEQIAKLEADRAKNRLMLSRLQAQADRIEKEIRRTVADERGADGKPAFSNEDKRAAEVAVRLERYEKYAAVQELARDTEWGVELATIRLGHLHRVFELQKLDRLEQANRAGRG